MLSFPLVHRVSKEALDLCHQIFTGGVFGKGMYEAGESIEAKQSSSAGRHQGDNVISGDFLPCEILKAYRGRPKGKGQRLKEGAENGAGHAGEGAQYINSSYAVSLV